MNTGERRREILRILKQTDTPVAARELAGRFGVSRQVIVQDLAVIRASTPGILSTTKGYVMQQDSSCTREFKVRHSQDKAAEELNLIVDCGGHVKNISISHRVYGRVSAEMDIRSRQDVNEFIEALQNSHSTVLSNATSGYHYHLIEAANEERLELIGEQLKKAAAKQAGLDGSVFSSFRIVKESLDARKKPQIFRVCNVQVTLASEKKERI